FLDERFSAERSRAALELLQQLAKKAISLAGKPDAGIWEYRGIWEPQTFSSLLCWAAADRMATISARHAPTQTELFRCAADRIREEIVTKAWNDKCGSFVGHYGGRDLDA